MLGIVASVIILYSAAFKFKLPHKIRRTICHADFSSALWIFLDFIQTIMVAYAGVTLYRRKSRKSTKHNKYLINQLCRKC